MATKEIVSDGEKYQITKLDRSTGGVETEVLSVDGNSGLITAKNLTVTGTLTPAITSTPGAFAVTGVLTAGGVKALASRIQGAKGADVTSAATLTLGTDGNFFKITGTTNIDFITTTGWQAGSEITLLFAGSLTLNHNTGSPPGTAAALFLAASGNVSATANDMIKFVYDGTLWRQVAAILAV